MNARPPSDTAAKQQARLRRREEALVRRATMSPTAPAVDRFRIATWNVNSLRARTPAVRRFLERTRPDAICLQETKASEIAPVAADMFAELGYTVAYSGSGAYNGVAIASLCAQSGHRIR